MISDIIENIWIVEKSGIVVFSDINEAIIHEQLFGAIMSALDQFAEKVTKERLSSFELNSIKFTILKKDLFLFIVSSKKNVKKKQLIKELNQITDIFFKNYQMKLEDWDYNLDIFSNFKEILEGNNISEKLKKALW